MTMMKTGTLDGIDIHALRDGELDTVVGGGGGHFPGLGVNGATNIEVMSVWRDLCYQLFDRTFG
jgi:hypothetical protein